MASAMFPTILPSSDPVGTMSPRGGSAEDMSLLQRRLADESVDRDNAKVVLQRFAKALEFYKHRLAALASPSAGYPEVAEANVRRVREIVQTMEKEIRDIGTPRHPVQELQAPAQSPRQGYDVLRYSLEDAQRRCESLNCDMVHQAEANEELVDALGTQKDTNKRLLEQVRAQTDEIAQLTQQRVGDEERMEKLTRQHQADHDTFHQNLQKQIIAIRNAAGEEYGACSRRLVDKLRYLKTRIGILAQDAGQINQEQQRMRLDVAAMVDTSLGQMLSAERDIGARCSDHVEMCAKRRQITEDAIEDLEGKLSAEKDLRHSEGLSWAHKHSTLTVEREDVDSRTSKDINEMTASLLALERTLSSERHAAALLMSKMEKEHEDARDNYKSMQRQSDQPQRDLVRLETSRSALETECRAKEQAIADLRRQCRESDDALAAAVSGNEHLRTQMEEQRKRFYEKNESDAMDARADFEQKFTDARVSQTSDVDTASNQLQSMEDAIAKDVEILQTLNTQVARVDSEIESLERDTLMWKSQTESTRASRAAAEKEFKDSRQTFGIERLKLNAGIERFSTQTATYEEEIKKTLDHMEEFRRLSETREAEQLTRAASAEVVLRDGQDEHGNLKKRFFEILEARSRVDLEMTTTKQQVMEFETTLEKEYLSRKKAAEGDKKRFEEQLYGELRETQQARGQLEQQKELSASALRRVQEDSRTKLDAIERERMRIEETCRVDTAGAIVSVEKQQQYTESLEQDLHRLRALLTESEANYAWVRQELEREEREAQLAGRELQSGNHSTAIELEKLSKSERTLVLQIEETTKRTQVEQARLMKEFDAVRRAIADGQVSSPRSPGRSPARRR